MAKSTKEPICRPPVDSAAGCCNVEAVVSVDERGQMVLPKEIRDKVGIKVLSKEEQAARKTRDNGVRVYKSTGVEIKA